MGFIEYMDKQEILESLEDMVLDGGILIEGLEGEPSGTSAGAGDVVAGKALDMAKTKILDKTGDVKLYKLINRTAAKIPNASIKAIFTLLAVAARKTGLSIGDILKLVNVQGIKRIISAVKSNVIDSDLIRNATETLKNDRYKGDNGIALFANDLIKNNPELLNKAKKAVTQVVGNKAKTANEGIGSMIAAKVGGDILGKAADLVGLDNVMTNLFSKGTIKKYLPRPEDQKLLQVIFAMEDSEFFDNDKNMKQLMNKKALQRIGPLLYKWDDAKKKYMYDKIEQNGLSDKLNLNGYVKLVKQMRQEDPKQWKTLKKDAKKILGQVTGIMHV